MKEKGGCRTSLRDRIIETALLLFEEQGYHGVTVNQIVEEVGTSKGGFYHHFTSKDELLFVIHDTFITYVLEKATEANTTYTSPTKKLQAIVKNFVKVFDLYKSHIAVFYQEHIYLHARYEELINMKRSRFKDIIMNAISEGKKSGEFREDLSVEITGMAILGMVNWTYKWYRQSGEKSIDEIGDIFIDLILRALMKEDALCKGGIENVLIHVPDFR